MANSRASNHNQGLIMNRNQFLELIKEYIKQDPEVSAYISDHIAQALRESRKEVMARAADMEVALAVMVASRYKGKEELVLDKLRKWNGKSALRWDDVIKRLETKVK